MSFVKKSNAMIFLLMNAFLWGSSYVWSKMLLGFLPRFSILFICAFGGLISTFVLFRRSIKSITLKEIGPCVLISSFSVISNIFFMFALQHTSSSNTAFIVQLSVVITPVIMALIEHKLPERRIAISSITAVFGLLLLTWDFSSLSLNPGDLFALGNALFFSLHLAGLKLYSDKVDPVHFTFIHHSTNTAAFLTLTLMLEKGSIDLPALKSPVFAGLITASILVSVVTILLQSAAIKYVRAERATLIYTFEPVAALILGYVFLGEKPDGIKAVTGCLLILFSVMLSIVRAGKPFLRHIHSRAASKPLAE